MPSAAGIKAGKAFVIIEALNQTGPVLKSVRNDLLKLGKDLTRIGTSMITKSIISMTPAFLSTKVYEEFDDIMKKVEARSEGTAHQMAALREQAKLLGRETAFTAEQIGQIQMRLAQKGFSRPEMLEITPAIADLARAAGEGFNFFEDADAAARLVSGTLRAFKMDMEETTRVANLMAGATLDSSYELEGLVTSLQYSGPVAEAFNLSLEETLALLMTMANLEIDPSISGTAFRNLQLYATNTDAQDEFNKVLQESTGKTIEFADAAGNLHPIPDILHAIEVAMEGMGTATKGQILSKFFGQRAVVPAFGLGPTKDFAKNMVALQESVKNNRAATVAKEMESGLGGAWRDFLGGLEAVALAIGQSLAPALIDLGANIGVVLTWIGKWLKDNPQVVVQLIMVSTATLAAGVALFTLGLAIKMLSAATVPLIMLFNALSVSVVATRTAIALMIAVAKSQAVIWTLLTVGTLAWRMMLLTTVASLHLLMATLTVTKVALYGVLLVLQAIPIAIKLVIISVRLLGGTFLICSIAANLIVKAMWAFHFATNAIALVIANVIRALLSLRLAHILLIADLLITRGIVLANRLAFMLWQATLLTWRAAVIAGVVAIGMLAIAYRSLGTAIALFIMQNKLATITMAVLQFAVWAAINSIAAMQAVLAMAFSPYVVPVLAIAAALAILVGLLYLNRKTIFEALAQWIPSIQAGLQTLGTELGSWVRKMFTGGKALAQTLITTWTGVSDALTLGETELAWDIGLAGLQTAWLQFVKMLMTTWNDFTGFFIEAWAGAQSEFFRLGSDIYTGMADAAEGYLPDEVVAVMRAAGAGLKLKEGAVGKDTGDMLRNRQKSIDEADKAREEAIDASKKELSERLKILEDLKKKREAEDKATTDLDDAINAMEAEYKARADKLISDDPMGLNIDPLKALEALKQGTLEAAKQAYENSQRESIGPDKEEARHRAVIDKLDGIFINTEALNRFAVA